MRVLVTGARGFVGRNLCCALKNIRDGKDRRERYAGLLPLEVMEYDVESTPGPVSRRRRSGSRTRINAAAGRANVHGIQSPAMLGK